MEQVHGEEEGGQQPHRHPVQLGGEHVEHRDGRRAHQRRERAADVVSRRRRRCQVDDVLEVRAGQLPARDLGDDR